MEVFFNHDKHIEGKERVEAYFSERIKDELRRYEDRITRVEVHLSDQNGGKTGKNDKKCVLEVRTQGFKPIAVTEFSDTVEKAISGAIKKIDKSLNSLMGRLQAY